MSATKDPKTKSSKESVDRSVKARWGEKLGESFSPVSMYFLRNYHRLKFTVNKKVRGLNSVEAMLIIQIFSHKWDTRDPHPAMKTIATRMGISHRFAREVVSRLKAAGFLDRRVPFEGARNRYNFSKLIAKLEELYDQDAVENELKKEKKTKVPEIDKSEMVGEVA